MGNHEISLGTIGNIMEYGDYMAFKPVSTSILDG